MKKQRVRTPFFGTRLTALVATLASVVTTLAMAPRLAAQAPDFTAVSDAMLRSPDPGDWLHWRGTGDAWGYSPLDQITTDNVGQLQLAWSWAMDDTGSQEAAPLACRGDSRRSCHRRNRRRR